MKLVQNIPIIIFLVLLALSAEARRDPGLDWRQFQTKHFTIIYPAMASLAASRTAKLAEDYYFKVRDLFGYAPSDNIPIVLNPMHDLANGYAQSIFNKMEFYLAPPLDKSFGSREKSWLDSLIVHEFAHLCHGMQDKGFAKVLTTVFGNVQGVNFVAPQWWVEGVAVYAETELTSAGRGRNPYEQMRLAANLLSEEPWSFGQISVHSRFTLPWDRVYLPGYSLISRLELETKVDHLLADISQAQSSWPFFGLGYAWQQAAGIHPEDIWNTIRTKGRNDLFKIYGKPRLFMPKAYKVTDDPGHYYSHPVWTKSGHILAYRSGVTTIDELVCLNPATGQRQVLAKPGMLIGRFAYHPQSEYIVYAKLTENPVFDNTLVADLFQRDPDGREKRLTVNGRCWSPDVSKEGKIVCVVNQFGPTRLGLVNPRTGKITLIPGPTGALYRTPRWSPDGKRLAAVVRINGRQDVCLVDYKSGELRALTGWDEPGDHDPVWSPDGRYLFFISDRTGTHQLYAYALQERKLYQVSDAHLGVFEPALSLDGKTIAVAEYWTGNSQQICVAPLDPGSWTPVVLPPPSRQPEIPAEYALPLLEGIPYSAWSYLIPTFWLPMIAASEGQYMIGAISVRQDPLEFHTWLSQLYYHPWLQEWFGEFLYVNDETFLSLSAKAFSLPLTRWETTDTEGDYVLLQARKTGVEIRGKLPLSLFHAGDHFTRLELDLSCQTYRIFMRAGDFPDPLYTGMDSGVFFMDIIQSPKDLFPTLGMTFWLRDRLALPGHCYNGYTVWSALRVFLPSVFSHHALVLEASSTVRSGMFPDTTYATLPNGYPDISSPRYGLTFSSGYRLPLWYIDNGPGLIPVYFQALWTEILIHWGASWQTEISWSEWVQHAVSSIEMSMYVMMDVFWYVPLTLKPYLIFKNQTQEILFGINMNVDLW